MKKYIIFVLFTVFILSTASCKSNMNTNQTSNLTSENSSESSKTDTIVVEDESSIDNISEVEEINESIPDYAMMYINTYNEIIHSGKIAIVRECYDMETGSYLDVKYIEDEAVITKLNEYKNSDSYSKPLPEQVYLGMNAFWVVFEDGTVVGLYEDVDYGSVDESIEHIGNISNLPEGMSTYVKGIYEAYPNNYVSAKFTETNKYTVLSSIINNDKAFAKIDNISFHDTSLSITVTLSATERQFSGYSLYVYCKNCGKELDIKADSAEYFEEKQITITTELICADDCEKERYQIVLEINGTTFDINCNLS